MRAESPLEPEHIAGIEHVLEVKFKAWEKRLLIRLSREYKGEMHAATKADAKPPYAEAMRQWRSVQRSHSIESKLDKFLS